MAVLYFAETAILAFLVWNAWRKSRAATPPFTRVLLLIGLLIALQGAAQAAHFIVTDRNWRLVGFSLSVQAFRASCLYLALFLWFRLIRWQGADRRAVVIATIAGFLVAFANGAGAFLGIVAFFALATTVRWPEEIHGFQRALLLLLSPVIVALVTIQTQTTIGADSASTLLTLGRVRPPLLEGNLSITQLHEMKLTEPLGRLIEMALALFRAQAVVVFVRLLTLPVRLRGMSLKRRFMFNYFFIRLIPATLSTITIALLIYFGHGLSRAAHVRHDFDATLGRAFDLAVHISQEEVKSPRGDHAAHPSPAADSALAPYQAWLGEGNERSHIVVRTVAEDSTVQIRYSPGTPPPLLADSLFAPTDRDSAAGLIEAGGHLFLAAQHRFERPDSVAVQVSVPIDSSYLARVARRTRVDILVTAVPGLFIGPGEVRSAGDTAWTLQQIGIHAVSRPRTGNGFFQKPRYLARSFLPVGDWRNLNFQGLRGAVQLTVKAALMDFSMSGQDTAFLITSNAWTIVFLIAMVIIVALTESLAVRTGRGIITAVLSDILALRDAVLRIGKGDLDHRIPVHGKDEIAALSSSVNEMAADLKRQQLEIAEKERLEADLMVAREIQQRFLPQSAPVISGLDVAGVSIPSREVGGDLFYFLPLEEGRLGVALGDVSGKSVPAALLMSNVLAALRTEARLRADIHESLGRLNELIVEQVEPGRFVTLFYGIVDAGAGSIHYTSAGHNPPLKVSQSGEVEWLDEAGVPLGVVAQARYGSSAMPFASGDVLVLYSDGITEAMRPAPGRRAGPSSDDDMEFFDEERLADCVKALRGKNAADIVTGILQAVNRFADGTPQADDITIVVVRMK